MTIYIIACGKEKTQHSISACQMYIGSYFRACLRYARSQSNNGIYILSAKYGIIEEDKIIEPYDLTITDNEAVSVEYVKSQVIEKGLLNENIIMLGGKKYVTFVKKIWKNADHPLQGGLLKQISWMNHQVETEKMKKQMEMWK